MAARPLARTVHDGNALQEIARGEKAEIRSASGPSDRQRAGPAQRLASRQHKWRVVKDRRARADVAFKRSAEHRLAPALQGSSTQQAVDSNGRSSSGSRTRLSVA